MAYKVCKEPTLRRLEREMVYKPGGEGEALDWPFHSFRDSKSGDR